jgi:Iap family predicted aminopeptidase
MARVMPKDQQTGTWLVFFDAEDQGRIAGWDWILGSTAFVQNLKSAPEAVVIIDMIGDKHLNVFIEKNSDPLLTQQIWDHAAALGYQDHFIPEPRYSILDDHTPFLEAGIPAVDIIDFDYPFYHTIADNLDQISAQSLQMVGDTLLAWLELKGSSSANQVPAP